jgi:hypothetical protein
MSISNVAHRQLFLGSRVTAGLYCTFARQLSTSRLGASKKIAASDSQRSYQENDTVVSTLKKSAQLPKLPEAQPAETTKKPGFSVNTQYGFTDVRDTFELPSNWMIRSKQVVFVEAANAFLKDEHFIKTIPSGGTSYVRGL